MKKNTKTLIYVAAVAAGLVSVTGSPIKLDSMDVVHAEEVYRVDDPLSGDLAPLPEEHAYWAVSYDLDVNGGVCSTNYYVVTEEEPNVTLPIPTRDSYEFDGWYDAKGNKVTVANRDTGNLTALWITEAPSAKSWAVAYPLDANGGVCDTNFYTITMEEPVITLPIPTRDGYEFDGWYDENGVKVIEANDDTGKLTAHWTEMATAKSWAVVYPLDANGGICEQSDYIVTMEEPTTTLPIPTRDSYEFDGWYDEKGNKVTEGNPGTGPLTAHWTELPTAKSWAVAYNLNANGGVCDQKFYTVTQEEPTTTLPTPRETDMNLMVGMTRTVIR